MGYVSSKEGIRLLYAFEMLPPMFFADFLRDLSYQNAWEFLKLETGSVATPAEHGLVGWPKVTQDVTGRNICNHVPKNMIIVTIKPGALDISQPLFTRPKKIPSTYTAKV